MDSIFNQRKQERLFHIRPADLFLIAAVFLATLLLFFGNAHRRASARPMLLITVDGQEFGRFSLDEDRTIPIGVHNICTIEDGRVRMTEADCPDRLCLHMREIDAGGGSIVCLPNRVILQIVGEETAPDDISVDAVAR